MENPLKPQPLMAEVLPGFTVVAISLCAYGATHPDKLYLLTDNKNAAAILGSGLLALIVSWIIGTFFDALRDILEHFLDKQWPINWPYLLNESSENIQKLENSWLAHYFLTGNMWIALIVASASFAEILGWPYFWWIVGMLVPACVFLLNFWTLRKELRRLIGYDLGLPHNRAYTRIAPSSAAASSTFPNSEPGVGVVAIRDIPKGTLIFAPDDDQTIKVSADEVASLPDELRRLYQDFCPLKDGVYTCPLNFNALTPAWYLNDSDKPNCKFDTNLQIRAARDIKAGEEVLSHYSDYSE